ncbi:MAG: ketopantoate reductase family protein [Tropicimonas sp.]|uniref:ketopantoate reductase family protein n=1 Tax=Tropicimonas sp. TaxID=2067044 RepID=UPI003A853C5B
MCKVLIIGAGGVGGYLGARMCAAGHDVTFLVRGRRLEQLRRDGLVVDSEVAGGVWPVATATAQTVGAEYDYVVIAAKAYHLDEDFIQLLRALDNGTNHVIPFMNGLRHMLFLERVFGHERTLGGICRISATLSPDGVVRHLSRIQEFVVGGRTPSAQRAAGKFVAMAAGSGIDAWVEEDVEATLWTKLVGLAALAASTCLMRAPVGCISSTIEGRQFMSEILRETAGVAAAYGYPMPPGDYRTVLGQLTDQTSGISASMLRDLEAGGDTEGDHIIGDLHDRGAAAGLDLPLLRLAKIHLEAAALRKSRDAGVGERAPSASGA